jgi:glycosyltransferase involved in cell wall biosynthesis
MFLQKSKEDSVTINILKSNNRNSSIKHDELYDYLRIMKKGNNSVLISIILPLYNEEKTIRTLLESLPLSDSIEIIIVNDKSTDNSLAEIQKVANHHKFKIYHHSVNKGYGSAIKTGMLNATGDVIVSMDTDGQHSPDDILNLVKPIFEATADYTIGSRYLGSYYYRLPIATRLGEVLVEKAIQILFGIRIRNNQNGFRAFKKELIPIFKKVIFKGYAFCTEQIILARLAGYKIRECPIKVFGREYGYSKIILRKLTLDIFSCLLLYYLEKIRKNVINKPRSLRSLFF